MVFVVAFEIRIASVEPFVVAFVTEPFEDSFGY